LYSGFEWTSKCLGGLSEQKRKTEREKSFMTNGATLLEDLIASSNGKCNPIRNFSAEELIRATNNFDSSRIIQICSLVDECDYDSDQVTYVMYKGSLDDL
jgi:hypothetical protein